MSDNYKRLRNAFANCQTKLLSTLLKKMSAKEKDYLLSRKRSFLDEAASASHMEVMAILIENGIIKWRGLQDNNLVFVGLLQGYCPRKDNGIIYQYAGCCKKSL